MCIESVAPQRQICHFQHFCGGYGDMTNDSFEQKFEGYCGFNIIQFSCICGFVKICKGLYADLSKPQNQMSMIRQFFLNLRQMLHTNVKEYSV